MKPGKTTQQVEGTGQNRIGDDWYRAETSYNITVQPPDWEKLYQCNHGM